MTRFSRFLMLLPALVMMAACADPGLFLPKPYQPEGKGKPPTINLMMEDHVVVAVPEGMEANEAVILQGEVIKALLASDLIATVSAPPQATSHLKAEAMDGVARWTLTGPDGGQLARFETETNAPAVAQATAISQRVVAALYPQPRATSQADVPQVPEHGTPLIITAIFGAPESDRGLLRRTLGARLLDIGFINGEDDPQSAFRLQVLVELTESSPETNRLSFSWELKAPDETVLATINQANDIPAGSLDQSWPDIVSAVAPAAALGILDARLSAGAK